MRPCTAVPEFDVKDEDRDRREARLELRLGKLAIEKGLLTPDQLKEALEEQRLGVQRGRKRPRRLGVILAAKHFLTDDQVLALLDTFPAGYFKLLPGNSSLSQRLTRRLKKWQSHAANLRGLNAPGKLRYLATKLRYAPPKAKHKIYRRAYKLYQRIGKPLPPVLRNIEELNFAAVKDDVRLDLLPDRDPPIDPVDLGIPVAVPWPVGEEGPHRGSGSEILGARREEHYNLAREWPARRREC